MSRSLHPASRRYLKNLRSPWKIGLFFLGRLPTAWWWGIRVGQIDLQRAEVLLPYNWRSKNPFRSIYFAAQAGAAELSTGILLQLALQGRPPTSMLVVDLKMEFLKKASATLTFSCEDGAKVFETVETALDTGEPQTLTLLSTGRLPDGEVASRMWITWSVKKR